MLAKMIADLLQRRHRPSAVSQDESTNGRATGGANSLNALLRAPLAHPKSFDYESVAWYEAASQSADYMVQHMMCARNLVGRVPLLEFALDQCSIDGLVLEFGVYRGESLNIIARCCRQTVHGFDSFEGLPEDWTYYQKKGRFGLRGAIPELYAPNVELHKGWFDQTVPAFLAAHPGAARFVHVDCDLYSSARTVLDALATRVVPGTIIVFDEYLNYPGWQQHEHKAFREFVARTGIGYHYIGFASSGSSVALLVDKH